MKAGSERRKRRPRKRIEQERAVPASPEKEQASGEEPKVQEDEGRNLSYLVASLSEKEIELGDALVRPGWWEPFKVGAKPWVRLAATSFLVGMVRKRLSVLVCVGGDQRETGDKN